MSQNYADLEPFDVNENVVLRQRPRHWCAEAINASRRVSIIDQKTMQVVNMRVVDHLPAPGAEESWLAVPENAAGQPQLSPVLRLYLKHIVECHSKNEPSKNKENHYYGNEKRRAIARREPPHC